MFRKLAITALGAATLLTSPVPALAMPRGNGLPVIQNEAVQLVGQRKRRDFNRDNYYGRYGGRYGGNYYPYRKYGYRNHGYRHYGYGYYPYGYYNNGAAVVLGIIGLGTALAIANSYPRYSYYGDGYNGYVRDYDYNTASPDWIAACARKYRSFEPRTGLYTTYSGYKRPCQLP